MTDGKGNAIVAHPFEPVFDANSRVLVIGSFPSEVSRTAGFFYGHPRNRFWRVMAAVFGEDVPVTTAEKRAFLLRSRGDKMLRTGYSRRYFFCVPCILFCVGMAKVKVISSLYFVLKILDYSIFILVMLWYKHHWSIIMRNKIVSFLSVILISFVAACQQPTDNLGTVTNTINIVWRGSFSNAPLNPQNGWAYYDTTKKMSFVWDGTSWQVIAQDGKSIIWKGELSRPHIVSDTGEILTKYGAETSSVVYYPKYLISNYDNSVYVAGYGSNLVSTKSGNDWQIKKY
ncbi:MAG: hypothetical protein K2I74_01240 [Treponemataceae bacterium]|nr:hypothetical protein [Treponemataceae bacterium]